MKSKSNTKSEKEYDAWARSHRRAKRRKPPAGAGLEILLTGELLELGELLGAIFSPLLSQPPVMMSIPESMYRKLLMLCHPDKHGNSPLATEVTRWLIDEREKGRKQHGGIVVE